MKRAERMDTSAEMEGDAVPLLTVTEYHQFLAENWEKTQRMIKGKINED